MNIKSFLAFGLVLICLLGFVLPISVNALYYTGNGYDPDNHKGNGTNVGLSQGNITIKNGKVTIGGIGTIKNQSDAFSKITPKYKKIMVFAGGILTVTMVGIFVFQFTKLGAVATNPRERQEVLKGLMVSGVSAALLGSITFIVGLFFGLFK